MNRDDSGLNYLLRLLDERRQIAADNILTGRAPPEEYHRLCGVIQGIDFAKDIIKDLAKRMEDDDE